jgi:hypothetical protein
MNGPFTEAGYFPPEYYNARHPVKHKVEEVEYAAADAGKYVWGHKEIVAAAALGIGLIGTVFIARKMLRQPTSS